MTSIYEQAEAIEDDIQQRIKAKVSDLQRDSSLVADIICGMMDQASHHRQVCDMLYGPLDEAQGAAAELAAACDVAIRQIAEDEVRYVQMPKEGPDSCSSCSFFKAGSAEPDVGYPGECRWPSDIGTGDCPWGKS